MTPRLRNCLQKHQKRHDAGVRLRELAEVVVARYLARERRVDLAHPLLDEGVADPVDERHPAGALDRLRDGPARADVVDDLRAGLLREDDLGKERGGEVAGDELARVVEEEAAVGIAVEGNAKVGAFLERLRDDELAVLGEQRVRLVVREGSVQLEEARHHLDRQPLEHRRQHRARHPVRRVDHDLQRPDLGHVHERQHPIDVGGPDVGLFDRA